MCVKHCARGFKSAIYRDAASLARRIAASIAAISHDEQALARDEDAIY